MSNYGNRDTATGIASGRLVIDMSDKIHLLEDNRSALMTMLYQLPSAPAENPTFKWMTDEIPPKFDTVGASGLATTVLNVTTADFCKLFDFIKVPSSGEILRVTARTSSTQFTVTRFWGSAGTQTDKSSGEPIVNLGSGWAQFTGVRVSASDDTIISTNQTEVVNTAYTQIYKDVVALSRSLMESKTYGDNDRKYQQRLKALKHVRDQNQTAYHGANAISGSVTSSGGIAAFVDSSTTDTTTVLTETAWNQFLKKAFRYGGGGEKFAFMSRDVAGVVNEFASVNQRIDPGGDPDIYGVALQKWRSPWGVVNLVQDVSLEGATPFVGYGKYCVVVDKTEARRRVLHETELVLDAQLPDVDGKVDYYLTEAGYEWGHPKRHGLLNSVTG